MGTHEANLRAATVALAHAKEERVRLMGERDQAIRDAHRAGMSLSEIASIVGINRSRVGQIVSGPADG